MHHPTPALKEATPLNSGDVLEETWRTFWLKSLGGRAGYAPLEALKRMLWLKTLATRNPLVEGDSKR